MYLKSIEMQGFKSFANKMTLEFHDGITGIVGPNGSGKSNVADAVRWVLGEQSARQLRGGAMQDVIFSGTEARKPLGFASVAITLDNSDHALNIDYQEVTVTRRLYRSGESEYLLNKNSVKLRDIRELFYDTGVGKEGYSIIGQGQIDQILSGKPEERRELFDEAAGIVKFKRRKAQTMKKLEQEESNLVRVNDILSELSKQIGPLEKQSETARVYLAQKEEQKKLDVNFFLVEEDRTAKELEIIAEKTKIARDQSEDVNRQFARTREEYDKIEQVLVTLDREISALKDQVSKDQMFHTQTEGDIRLLNDQIRTISLQNQQASNRLLAIGAEKQQKEEELRETLSRLDETDRKLKEADSNNSGIIEELEELQDEILDLEDKLDERQKNIVTLLNKRGTTRGQLQRCDATMEQITIRRADIAQKLLQLKTDKNGQKTASERLMEEFRRISEETASLRDAVSAKDSSVSQLTGQLNSLAVEHENAQTSYHRDSSRLESLKNVAEHYEGYNNSIRKVMEQKSANPGIHGVVADLFQAEERYETAIETALGGSIQNIVTDNETTAKYLIEYLKKGRYGRATFLPLTAISASKPSFSAALLKEEGVIGIASDLVHYEQQYRALAFSLLGKTLVIDKIDRAIAIGKKYHHTIRMVTLEGELLSPGGSMTGGSFRNTNNLLGRKREIEELGKQVRKDSMLLNTLLQKQEDLRDQRNQLRTERGDLAAKLQTSMIALNTAKMKADSAKKEAGRFEEEYASLQHDMAVLDRQLSDLSEDKKQIQQELARSDQFESDSNRQIRQLSEELERKKAEEQKRKDILEQTRITYASLSSQLTFRRETSRRLETELAALEEEKELLTTTIGNDADLIREKEAQAAGKEEEIVRCEKHKARQEELILNKQQEKEENNRSHKLFFEKRDELSARIALLDKELFRLNTQQEKLDEARESRIDALWNEYELTPGHARELSIEMIGDRNELKKKLAEVKERIRKLGNVNVNAIEEYKEVKERYEFLSAQQQDLVNGAAKLRTIIADLETGMRRQFREKFEEIRLEFDKVFQELFGGGHGMLELENADDILEAGIRIIASPPGKRLQNMMQLSGGEKALTAISLLFAIQNLKPSPFCLLDEIEAALDDSNVFRFANYLHKLSKNTQFIVITHRRGTMNAADRLYGITMQEKGVSMLVSVDLIESEIK